MKSFFFHINSLITLGLHLGGKKSHKSVSKYLFAKKDKFWFLNLEVFNFNFNYIERLLDLFISRGCSFIFIESIDDELIIFKKILYSSNFILTQSPWYKGSFRNFRSIRKAIEVPDFIFMVDTTKRTSLIKELEKLNIPIIGISDLGLNLKKLDYSLITNLGSLKIKLFFFNLFFTLLVRLILKRVRIRKLFNLKKNKINFQKFFSIYKHNIKKRGI